MTRRAFTLAQTLVVVFILGVLIATLTLLLAPSVRAKGIETRIRGDLRQIAGGLNLYLADYDGKMPMEMRDMGAAVPQRYPNWPRVTPYWPTPTDGEYQIAYNQTWQRIEPMATFKYPFDYAKYAVVQANFYGREVKGPLTYERFSAPGVSSMAKKPKDWTVLGARLDGSVYWKPHWEPWQHERAASLGLVVNQPLR